MKRRNIFWCLAAITLFASCTAIEMEPEIQNPDRDTNKPKQTITINAVTVDDNADTRAIHGTEENQTSFSWQAGIDKIGVIKGADEYGDGELIWGMDHHRFSNTQDGQIATFVYDIDEEGAGLVWGDELTLSVGDQIVAYYPYATAASSWYDSTKPWLMSSHGALVQHGDNNTEHLFRGDYMAWGLAEFDAEQRGYKDGVADGEHQAKIETAKTALSMNLPLEQIVKLTGLSIDTIKNLK